MYYYVFIHLYKDSKTSIKTYHRLSHFGIQQQNFQLTSSIPATCSGIPLILPIQRITPKSGGSFTSTIDPTSRSLSNPASPSSHSASQLSGDLSGEGGPCTPLVCCSWSVEVGDVGLRGLGGGRGGRGL